MQSLKGFQMIEDYRGGPSDWALDADAVIAV